MKRGFLGIAPPGPEQEPALQLLLPEAGFETSFDDHLHQLRVRRRQTRLTALARSELRDWFLLHPDRLRLLQFGIRLVLGTLLFFPVAASFVLFCTIAFCTDKLGQK